MAAPDYEVIVIGAGITGLTAAKALAQRGAAVANLEGGLFGGLVTNINELDGGFEGSGADFASTLMMEVTDLGCAALAEQATGLVREGDDVVVITPDGPRRARAVVVASGATIRRLGIPGEAALEYKGVSHCADCDGPMFQGQDVVVAGGGDSALQEALVLSRYCASVRIVHHGVAPTARARWVDALRERGNVSLLPHAELEAIEGADAVEAVRVRLLRDGGTRTIPCAGVFGYVGLTPATAFLPPEVERDDRGAIVTNAGLATTMPRVFAAGAARAGHGGTLADAMREGQVAAGAALACARG